jgi:hypothetical protein
MASSLTDCGLFPPPPLFFLFYIYVIFIYLIFGVIRKCRDGIGILEEWEYNTPIF